MYARTYVLAYSLLKDVLGYVRTYGRPTVSILWEGRARLRKDLIAYARKYVSILGEGALHETYMWFPITFPKEKGK